MGSSFKGKSRVTLSAMSQLIFPHQGLNFGGGGFNAAHETEFVLHQGMVNDDRLVGQACTPGQIQEFRIARGRDVRVAKALDPLANWKL